VQQKGLVALRKSARNPITTGFVAVLYFETEEFPEEGWIGCFGEDNGAYEHRWNQVPLGVIETRYRQHGKIAMYNLTINRQLWACVEWSPSRKAWCVQDARGRCLAHCDAIHGENVDAQTAAKLAKAMIRDGRMPPNSS
jgi:hypothetical protein